ncbi:uncharacterized protein LOC101859211 isoform X1 [Aplysia californica]|uniref:Uncharacterized protein LOC101859211 isoform X1 n=1 Tax=Aplysia californica TaxID=6500 RepID=A0ABM0JB48_APLCA|nr:uncharacterized protein LOC101859211 isoform X1 [Aplysia californica]
MIQLVTNMLEESSNIAASNFISSLVKSLQILCNGQVDFNESIELIGHINVRVDHKFKFNYIVDEQVSKEGDDASTTFLSNSYHSSPPSRLSTKQVPHDEEIIDSQRAKKNVKKSSDIPHDKPRQSASAMGSLSDSEETESAQQKYSVKYDAPVVSETAGNHMVIKVEGDDPSDDCVVLPGSPGEYNECGESSGSLHSEGQQFPGSSGCYVGSQNEHQSGPGPAKKQRQSREQGSAEGAELKSPPRIPSTALPSASSESGTVALKQSENMSEVLSSKNDDPVESVRQLISKLAALCNMSVVQESLGGFTNSSVDNASIDDLKIAKKKLLENLNKDKIRKMKEVLKTKKGKRRKQELKALIAESGLTNEQLLLLAHNAPQYQRKVSWKSIPEGPDKKEMLKEHRKSLRMRTQERQERLLEMAEMLKRNQLNDQGITVISKSGGRKCTLNKSSVSVVSHNTQQLKVENIDEAVDALSGKVKKAILPFKRADKVKDELKMEVHKKHVVKRKVRQIVGKILSEVSEAGYRAVFTNTIGSDAGSHSAELTIVPLKIDELLPENKETDIKAEMSEDEYAKHLEREQFIEKQKVNEEKMKDLEDKLIRILTGTEEVFIPTRKRYAPGEVRPTDAERMKEYRKKLKEDPDKYQVYKQKRAMSKKRRRLSALAAKMKDANANTQVLPANPVNDDTHVSQSIGSLVTITQPSVGNVNMHCPQVYGHPSDHQPPASVVNVHRSNQFVGQVSGIHTSHQHQQPMAYGNEMDIVELIAATHSVQNQHYA